MKNAAPKVAQAAVEGTQAAVPRVVQLGMKTSDMLNAGISKVAALKPVAAMRNSSVVNNASNWVGGNSMVRRSEMLVIFKLGRQER